MPDFSLSICHLFPDILTLTGDTGNVKAIEYRCKKRGIKTETTQIFSNEKPDFSSFDIVIIGGGSDYDTKMLLKNTLLKESLISFVESDGVVLAVSSGFKMFSAFSLIDAEFKGEKKISGDAVLKLDLDGEEAIVSGFLSQTGEVVLGKASPLGKVIMGFGETEGVRYKNAFLTNLSGPILPAAPELSDYMIKKAIKRKYNEDITLTEMDNTIEDLAKEFIISRNRTETQR